MRIVDSNSKRIEMKNTDPDDFYDRNLSSLLERSTTTSVRRINRDAAPPALIDQLESKIASLEERLNSSDSVYRMASQATASRERERRQKLQQLSEQAESLSVRISKVEEITASLQRSVKPAVAEELRKANPVESLKAQLEQTKADVAAQFEALEAKVAANNQRVQKSIKKLQTEIKLLKEGPENERVEELRLQINEVKRRQVMMAEFIEAMKSRNAQDLTTFNAHMSGLFAQLGGV